MNIKQEVKRARKGDHEAFMRLVYNMRLPMYGLAFSILRRDEDCADAMQETILKAYKSLHTLRKAEFFQTWVFRILINECNRLIANKARVIPMDNFEHIPNKGSAYDEIDLREAVDHLEEPLRVVVVLHYFHDMKLRTVGEILGISENAAKARLFRARQQLLTELEESPERKIAHEPVGY